MASSFGGATRDQMQSPPTAPPALVPSAVPEIGGTPRYRSVLSIEEPDWGPGRVEQEYRWLRDGKPISGASELSYRLAAADIGHKVEHLPGTVRQPADFLHSGHQRPFSSFACRAARISAKSLPA